MSHFNLGGISRHPNRPLPYDPCLGCNQGDSSHIVAIEGDGDWLAGCLIILASFDAKEAVRWVAEYWPRLQVSERVPEHRMVLMVLCRACAEEANRLVGVPLVTRGQVDEEIAVFCQPQEEGPDGAGH